MPRGLSPIDIKVAVAESPVWPDFQLNELAEVVLIQFKQVGHNGLLLQRGGNNFDLRRRIL